MSRKGVLAAAIVTTLVGGGVASAQTSEGDTSQTITIEVAATRSITLEGPVASASLAAAEEPSPLRPNDVQEIEGGTITYSTDTPYSDSASGDIIAVQRVDDPKNPSTDGFTIQLLASGISCSCSYGGATADPSPADPGVQPTEVTTDGVSRIITDIFETGNSGATASLTYTIITEGAVPGTYSFTITYTIREA